MLLKTPSEVPNTEALGCHRVASTTRANRAITATMLQHHVAVYCAQRARFHWASKLTDRPQANNSINPRILAQRHCPTFAPMGTRSTSSSSPVGVLLENVPGLRSAERCASSHLGPPVKLCPSTRCLNETPKTLAEVSGERAAQAWERCVSNPINPGKIQLGMPHTRTLLTARVTVLCHSSNSSTCVDDDPPAPPVPLLV